MGPEIESNREKMTAASPGAADLLSLHGEVAVVTGAASGMGLAVAWRLLSAGASVVLADRDGEAGAAAAERMDSELGRSAAQVRFERCDVTDDESVRKVVETTVGHFGKLTILVNSAGIFPPGTALGVGLDVWDRVLEVDLKGTFICCREAAEAMIDCGGGRIVNFSSTSSTHYPFPGMPHYIAAKAGVDGLTRSLAIELGPHGIRVNAVAPGGTATEGQKAKLAAGDFPEELLDLVERRSPLRRFAEPDEQARVVLFLVSEASSYLTGQSLIVDGGMTLV
jgi:NAD(P)-dependent dehydrogenase (short-subunit alcohol dehydrogenase family)